MICEFQNEHRWLSNFWPVKVRYGDTIYPSVENAYQASKTSYRSRHNILATISPGEAKRFARSFKLPEGWLLRRDDIMRGLLVQKFQHPILRTKLLATGDDKIQEGNRWGDEYWGVDLRTGKGQNILGKMIMQIRDDVRCEESL